MFKIVLFVTIFFSATIADEFYINPYYLDKLQKNSRSYKIIKHYVNFLNSIKDDNDNTKIEKVNRYINKIIPKYDANNYKTEEYWATPFEFFSNVGGDCEDYVIVKMYSLKRLGISPKLMYMSVVKEKYLGGDHMVLSLHVDKTRPPLVLDNLSTKVLTIDKRVDLELVFMFNEYGFYKLKNNNILQKIDKINLQSYTNFKNRDRKNLILKR
jgi:predicted transglutaminase-like cysteine proteinase